MPKVFDVKKQFAKDGFAFYSAQYTSYRLK